MKRINKSKRRIALERWRREQRNLIALSKRLQQIQERKQPQSIREQQREAVVESSRRSFLYGT